ncbi:MAG: hypothetical protein LAT84_08940 [Balneolia bacterium]|nr:hypothetical protein [Balneolia bacterium]
MRITILLFAFLCVLAGGLTDGFINPAMAQTQAPVYENVYRSAQKHFTLTTPRFRIIYPEGQQEVALRTARVLEDQYSMIQSLVGGSLRHFPVVLNDHNDLSNGYVTPIHFRTEIEIPAIKGRSLNPRTGGWIENVAPHELVHALHFSNIPSGSTVSLIYPFAPDLTRSLHGIAPFGMIEGIAVFHETKVVYGQGGRGNLSIFRNATHSNLSSDRPWSLAQHLMPASYSLPGNRHYAGGYEFIRWLQYNYGMETTRNTIETFVQLPLLGYGRALRQATGESTRTLYRQYMADMQEHLAEEHPSSRISQDETAGQGEAIPARAPDENQNRPQWLDNDRIIFAQPTQYNSRPGFYVYDLSSGRTRLLYESRMVGDFNYHLSPERDRLVYSRYNRHPYHVNAWVMDAFEVNTETRRAQRLSRNARIHAPVYSGLQDDAQDSGIIGLKTVNETSQPARVKDDGSAEVIYSIYPDTFIQLEPSPAEAGTYAVIANRNGLQALWIVRDSDFSTVSGSNPDVAFRNGIIHDFSWSPDGENILLSGTMENVAQVYEYNPRALNLTRLTQSRFGAVQPSYSPDQSRIAYIEQIDNSNRVMVMEVKNAFGREYQPVEFQPDVSSSLEASRLSDHRNSDESSWEFAEYRSGISWLRPRVFLPAIYEGSSPVLDTRFGLIAQGGDVLRRHAWLAEVTYANEHLWTELFYRNSTFWPGYQIEAFYSPLPTFRGLYKERGGTFSLPFTWQMNHRSRSTYWQFRPGIRGRQFRPYKLLPIPENEQINTEWFTDISVRGFLGYFFRLQQNIRDIQPNTGTVLFTQAEQFIISDREARVAGIRFGIQQYLSPAPRWNHGLFLGAEAITQTPVRLFNTSNLVYRGFGENVLAGLQNAGSLRARYVLPIRYVDNGFISVPFFMDRIYLALEANYVADLNELSQENFSTIGRAVYGIELRTNIRIYNLPLDLGIGFGFEPTRRELHLFSGTR